MIRLVTRAAFFAFGLSALCACAMNGSVAPLGGQASREVPAGVDARPATSAQYLYVYNTGAPGSIPGSYVRYNIPDLTVAESTETDGVASPDAFNSEGLSFFVDEASGHSGFSVYEQPLESKEVPGEQFFSGIPCQSTSLAIGPTGDFYVVQYCSANVLKYLPADIHGNSKKPIAKYTGGNLGKGGVTDPITAAVDPKGNLYVGDNAGGVTFFPAGSTKGQVAFPTGNGGYVNQMVVAKNGDVWSLHGPDPTAVYFDNKIDCVPDPKGSIVRNEYAERFSNGTLVQHLYTATSDSPFYTNNGLSMALDSTGRIYTGNENAGTPGIILDFPPGRSCPDDTLSFTEPAGANPQVAVDAEHRLYVTDYHVNTIAVYNAATTKPIHKITQKNGFISITYARMSP